MRMLLLNIVIATGWLVLADGRPASDFLIGFAVGFAVLSVFSAVRSGGRYPRHCLAFARFVLIFAWEFLSANLSVARVVLFQRKDRLRPDFIDYDVTGMRRHEILLLSYSITLTPGTTTVSVSEDFRTLTIHALDAGAPEATCKQIDRRLKNPILHFTR